MATLFDCLEATGTVLAINQVGEAAEDDRASLELSETVMLFETPERLADRGWINKERVLQVSRSNTGQIRHHHDGREDHFHVGQKVRIKLDPAWRDQQARLYCAGRLIELVGPIVFADFVPVAADFRPFRAKIDFGAPDYIPDPETVLSDFCQEIERCISLDLPVKTTVVEHASFRRVQIGDFRPFTCSGVYPGSLGKIGKVTITRILSIGGRLQVRFRVGESLMT